MTPKETVNDIISKNYKSLLKTAKNVVKSNEYQDVLHECLAEIIEFDDDKINYILPYFNFYLIRMMQYSCLSNSPYYRKYKKTNIVLDTNDYGLEYMLQSIPEHINYLDKDELHNLNLIEETDSDDTQAETIKEIYKILSEQCTWYQRSVFLYKIENNLSFNRFEKDTKIPASSIFKTYNEVVSIIKSNLKNKHT